MSPQRGSKRKRQPVKSNEKTTAKRTQAKGPAQDVVTPREGEVRVRLDDGEALAAVQDALKSARSELEQERGARLAAEKARADAEQALAEARSEIGSESAKTEALPESLTPPAARVKSDQESAKSPPVLIVSEVRVFRIGVPGAMTLTLRPSETFKVQARFEIRGPGSVSLSATEASFETRVYANDLATGTSQQLAAQGGNLAEGVLDYTTELQAPALTSGAYRLVTVIALREPIAIAGHYEGPILDVADAQTLASVNHLQEASWS
jgi:hypothetical protein